MKIFENTTALAAASLSTGQMISVKEVGEYRIKASGSGITLANGNIAVPVASGTSVNVKQFGAVGDGVEDDTAAIQAAINSGAAQVFIPEGEYKLTSPLSLHQIQLLGASHDSTILKPVDCKAITINGADEVGGFAYNVLVSDIGIDNTNVTVALANSIYLNDSYRTILRNVRLFSNDIDTTTGFTAVIEVAGECLFNAFENISVVGTGGSTGSCVEVSTTKGRLLCKGLDVEFAYKGLYVNADASIDVVGFFAERLSKAVYIDGGGVATNPSHININGGEIELTYISSVGINFDGTFANGEMFSFENIDIRSDNHSTKTAAFGGAGAGLTWNNDNRMVVHNTRQDWHTGFAVIAPYEITPASDTGATEAFTIASGVIGAPSKRVIVVDTEGAAGTDDLDTIGAGYVGQLLVVTAANSARDIVLKHATGNLRMTGRADFTLDHTADTAAFIYDGSFWVSLAVSNNNI